MLKNADVCRCPRAGQLWSCACKKSSVGPIGTAVVCSRTEEPGEQRFCESRRLKTANGTAFFRMGRRLRQCSSSATAFGARPRRPSCWPNRSYLLETTTRLLDRRRPSMAAVVVFARRRDNEIHFACNKPRPHIRLICRDSG